jgi:hypothetical protein
MSNSRATASMLMLLGTITFFVASHVKDHLNDQEVKHTMDSVFAYAKAHPNSSEADLDKVMVQERSSYIEQTHIKRLGVSSAEYCSLLIMLGAVVIFYRRQKHRETEA